ncbi:hypothetical protein K492DRAFT_181070 [Lichtheimia hyalospora FSU 10163]|nr:hypothetical protein K492DRAFT_181070 [Lichtheimia hyalospora FSU 10163]
MAQCTPNLMMLIIISHTQALDNILHQQMVQSTSTVSDRSTTSWINVKFVKQLLRNWTREEITERSELYQDAYRELANDEVKAFSAQKKKFEKDARGRKGNFSIHTCEGDRSKLQKLR